MRYPPPKKKYIGLQIFLKIILIFMKFISSKRFPLFLVFLKYFGIFESINKGSPGLGNPEIMEMLGLGPSPNEIKILLDQNWPK